MLTLGQLKSSTIPAAVGLAPCDPRFVTLANEAQMRLVNKGRYWGTTKRLRICVTAKCITWPAGVVTVEGFNISGYGIPLRNGWYEFQDNVATTEVGRCSCSAQQLLDRGFTPQYRDITANSTIRIYPVSSADEDAVILLQGTDHNGEPIRNSDGDEFFDGERVVIASPFVDSVALFKAPGLTGAQKPITKSYLKVFAVDNATGVETQIATWGPSETNPSYRRSTLVHLPTGCNIDDTGDGCSAGLVNCSNVVADSIVRLEPLPLVVDSDWLLIGNLAAMKGAMKSIQKEDNNDYVAASHEMSGAVLRLKEELAKFEPPERIQINVDLGVTSAFCGLGR